jgi:formylmethanofuran dehydrogenase subunit A
LSRIRIRGARLIDPARNVDGVADLYARDGVITAADEATRFDHDLDASGCILMAGAIDLHSHIGGGKVTLARQLLPEDHRDCGPAAPHELPSSGTCTPGTLATGYRYAEMGYTAAFEPAMLAANARQAHFEMGDVPIIDHGAYVMLGNDELFLQLLARGEHERLRDYVGWAINATKALAVKVVNPGGISAFKFNQRALEVDEAHAHHGVTPRQVVQALAQALGELGVPHPLHIHASNLGVPGNIASTLATIDALEGRPAHLTHVQFHSYGTEGPRKFSSAALQLAEVVNTRRNVSIDVGQILFGQTVTASGDTMRQFANAHLAQPKKWIGADIECDAGCGVVPFRYRETSYVNALQWAIGLELFLRVEDPWRIVLTTDHPNGAPFTSYPHLIRLLMDRGFRDAQFARLHPDAQAHSALSQMKRELDYREIAILTRAAPARLLGLHDRGHLGVGAIADLVLYREQADREAMFARPTHVFRRGELVARDGRIVAAPRGGTLFVEPDFDPAIEATVEQYAGRHLATSARNLRISHDELCSCCNRGAPLLPVACLAEGRGGEVHQ